MYSYNGERFTYDEPKQEPKPVLLCDIAIASNAEVIGIKHSCADNIVITPKMVVIYCAGDPPKGLVGTTPFPGVTLLLFEIGCNAISEELYELVDRLSISSTVANDVILKYAPKIGKLFTSTKMIPILGLIPADAEIWITGDVNEILAALPEDVKDISIRTTIGIDFNLLKRFTQLKKLCLLGFSGAPMPQNAGLILNNSKEKTIRTILMLPNLQNLDARMTVKREWIENNETLIYTKGVRIEGDDGTILGSILDRNNQYRDGFRFARVKVATD